VSHLSVRIVFSVDEMTGPLVFSHRGLYSTSFLVESICIYIAPIKVSTYDHKVWRTGLPVRSAVLKPHVKGGQPSILPFPRCRSNGHDRVSTSQVQVIEVMPLESRVSVGVMSG